MLSSIINFLCIVLPSLYPQRPLPDFPARTEEKLTDVHISVEAEADRTKRLDRTEWRAEY